MRVFNGSKWIWYKNARSVDDYGEFYGAINYDGGRVVCRISADSDYALYINGMFVTSNQYGDFPYYKAYDELDVTEFLQKGGNHVAILAWYFGVGSQKYYPSDAGVIFEFVQGDTPLLQSDERIVARQSASYACGRAKNVSYQLGMSFLCDLSREDNWKTGELMGFAPSCLVKKDCQFVARPNKKLVYGKEVEPISMEQRHSLRTVLVDLGRETVGLPSLKFYSDVEQRITVCFGEQIVGENVSRYIGGNDYSFELIAKSGENEYFNPFLRLGCRYLQLCAQEPIKVEKLTLIPFTYPLTRKGRIGLEKRDGEIYELCVRTLELCAFEHYVDCPFREQGLYAFDSRNQMLAGYYAFEDGEYFKYAKSNLLLFAQDRRQDKLLTITSPSDTELLIPAFSMHYVIAVLEYLQYFNEKKIEKSIFEKVSDIVSVFADRIRDGLVQNFNGEGYWNFYDWTTNAERVTASSDLFLNSLYILTAEAYLEICATVGETPIANLRIDEVRKRAYDEFFDKEKGLFVPFKGVNAYMQLANSLAILSKIADGKQAKSIVEKILAGETIESTLSTKRFFYDAMIAVDKEKYARTILDEIRKNYGFMLDTGATSTWETLDGADPFASRLSLCHGWSAIPVYYFNILLKG